MKPIIVLSFVLLCALSSTAQKTDVPANIKAAFLKNYARARNVKWDKEHDKYEASFTNGSQHMSVSYNADATIDETEISIAIDKLPANAKKYAEAKGKIMDAALITKADGTQVYEAEVNKTDLIFDKAGKFIREVKD